MPKIANLIPCLFDLATNLVVLTVLTPNYNEHIETSNGRTVNSL